MAAGKSPLDIKAWRSGPVAADAARYLRDQFTKATKDVNHMAFIGSPMSQEEMEAHYPSRPSIVTEDWQTLAQLQTAAQVSDEDDPLPLFHFKQLHINDPDELQAMVELGDCVLVKQAGKVDPDGKALTSVLRVTELFVDVQGERHFKGLWFYDALDTIMATDVPLASEVIRKCKRADKDFDAENARTMPCELTDQQQRLWLATTNDSASYSSIYPLAVIDDVVRVFHVTPGRKVHEQYPEFDPEVDHWYNQVHTCEYNSLEDCYQDWSLWSGHYKLLLEAGGLEAVRALQQLEPATLIRGGMPDTEDLGLPLPPVHEGPVVCKCLDIFAGAGGLSFLHQRNSSGSVKICGGWAVDINDSAAATYKANHPDVAVYAIGLDEFLWLLRLWSGIVAFYLGRDWRRGQAPSVTTAPPPRPGAKAAAEAAAKASAKAAADRAAAEAAAKAAARAAKAAAKAAGSKPAAAGAAEPAGKEAAGEAAAEPRATQGQVVGYVTEEPFGEVEVEEVLDVRIQDNAPRFTSTSNKGQLTNGLTRQQCWLEFYVVPKGGGAREWVRASSISRASFKVVQAFVLAKANKGDIPQPGDVDVVAGGPPCQDVSGLNRHAKQQDVLGTPKNRLVASYFELVDFLEPKFILVEQVADIFKKEGGLYGRFAICLLVEHGYQVRAGVLTAGEFGVSQGRRRVFMWGARSGKEQLVPLPAPTHECKDFCTGHPKSAKQCIVSALPGTKLHPMVTLGDILSDLPEVHNFCMGNRSYHLSEPNTPAQAFLRRQPPAGTSTPAQRAAAADVYMKPGLDCARMMMVELEQRAGLAAIGQTGLCQKQHDAKGCFAGETVEAHFDKEVPAESEGEEGWGLRSWKRLMLDLDKEHTKIALGTTMKAQQAAADAVSEGAPLRDHRPLQNNMDDYSRMCAVPREYLANFRDMPGVVTHIDGTCCGGSWHAKDTGAAACACPGGGVQGRRGSNNKADRVDQYGAVDSKTCSEQEGEPLAPQEDGQGADTQARPLSTQLPAGAGGRAGSSKAGPSRGPRRAAAAAQAAAVEAMTQAAADEEGGQQQAPKGKGRPPLPPAAAAAVAAAAARAAAAADEGEDGNPGPSSSGAKPPPQRPNWRGTQLLPCSSRTLLLGTNDLLAPRWVITYKHGLSQGRHGCYGRAWYCDIQPTVVGRAEPHNLQLLHPEQDRVLTVRENARCQGFPDYYALVGLDSGSTGHGLGGASVHQRYLQMGNAVAPPVAAALGRCLLMAAEGKAPVGVPVVFTPDPEYEAAVAAARAKGQRFWIEENELPNLRGNDWSRHLPDDGQVVEETEDDEDGSGGGGDDSDGDGPGGAPKAKSRPKVTRTKAPAGGKRKGPAKRARGPAKAAAVATAAGAAGPSRGGGSRAAGGKVAPAQQGRKRARAAAAAPPGAAAGGAEGTQPLPQQQQVHPGAAAGTAAAAAGGATRAAAPRQSREGVQGCLWPVASAGAGQGGSGRHGAGPGPQSQQEQQDAPAAKKQRLAPAAAAAGAAGRSGTPAAAGAAAGAAPRATAAPPAQPRPAQQQLVGSRGRAGQRAQQPEEEPESDELSAEELEGEAAAAAEASQGSLSEGGSSDEEEEQQPSSSSSSEGEEEEEDDSDCSEGDEDSDDDDLRITSKRPRAAAAGAARGQQVGNSSRRQSARAAAAGAGGKRGAAAAAGGGAAGGSRPRRSSAAAVVYTVPDTDEEEDEEEEEGVTESESEGDVSDQSEGGNGSPELGQADSSQQEEEEVGDKADLLQEDAAAEVEPDTADMDEGGDEEGSEGWGEEQEEVAPAAVSKHGSVRQCQAAAAAAAAAGAGTDSDKENRPSPAAADDCGRSPAARKRPAAAGGGAGGGASGGKRLRGGPPRAAVTPELLLAGVDLEKRSESPVVHAGASMLCMPNSVVREVDRDVC